MNTNQIGLMFETPDRNRGQIVTYSYAVTPSGAKIECRHDGADQSVTYRWVTSGRRLTATQLARYKLTESV